MRQYYTPIELSNKSYINFLRKYLYLTLFSLYLTPSIRIFGLPAIRIEEILIIIIVLILFIRILKGESILISWGVRQKLLIGFLFIIAISILNGTIKGHSTSFLELLEFVKIFKYLFIYTIAATVFNLSENKAYEIEKLIHFIFKLSIILFVIVLQQYFNPFNLNSLYITLIAPTQFETLVGSYPSPRPVGMVGNPNVLGFLLALTTLLSLFQIFAKRLNVKYLIVLITNSLGMFLTLSRSSLVALLVGFLILTLIFINFRSLLNVNVKKISRVGILTFILIIVVMYTLTYTDFTKEIFWRFEALSDLSSDNSWQARLNHWQVNIRLFVENPILGLGPLSRTEFQFAADNEWLLLLRSYGIVGMTYFVLMFLIPFIKSERGNLKILGLAVLFSSSIYMIPAAAFSSLILMPLIMIIFSMSDKRGKIITIKR